MFSSVHNSVRRVGVSAVVGVLLIGAGVGCAAADDAYTPTMKDMRSIENALERYLKGFDTHDAKLQASAFWDDAVIVEPRGDKVSVKEMMKMGSGPRPGAPPGQAGAAPGGPPPGAPPSCDAKAGMPKKGWEIWHIVANSSFEFESPTRARHHAYWFAVCPGAGPNNGAGLAAVGPPGSYSDILEKRHGEWRLISRYIGLNVMYPKD